MVECANIANTFILFITLNFQFVQKENNIRKISRYVLPAVREGNGVGV